MTTPMMTAVDPESKCVNCKGTAQFHVQNPFGVRFYQYYGQPKYFGWNNIPSDHPGFMTCPEFVGVIDGVTKTYDHDTLFMYLMSSRDMMM